jgi:hypothetical protein
VAGELLTQDNQAQFGETLLMGPGTGYVITGAGITGWEDSPGFDSADVLRPGSAGAWPGARFAQTRTVTVPVSILPMHDPDGRDGTQLLRALQLATRINADEVELAIRMRGETLMCWARINSRIPEALGTTWMAMGEVGLPLQFLATDPRRYSLEEHTLSAGPPTRSEGLQYVAAGGADRIEYTAVGGVGRLDWGVDGNIGNVTAINAGTESTPPVITFYGPTTTPSVLVQSAETDDLVLEYDIALVSGETLTLDPRAGTVLLNGSADRNYTVTARSGLLEELLLPPGESQLSFRQQSTDTASSMTVAWRDAYM